MANTDLADGVVQVLRSTGALGKLAAQVGLSDDQASTLATGATRMIINGLAQEANDPSRAPGLHQALANDHDGGVLNNLPAAVTADSTQADGAAILNHVFGNQQSSVTNTLSGTSGTSTDSTMQMLQVLAPVVMGAVGQAHRQQGSSPQALGSLLAGGSTPPQTTR